MSRRWYRHIDRVVFVGWEPAEQGFYVNVVALCGVCGGSGEQDGSDEICTGCNGEGIAVGVHSPSNRQAGLTLDQVGGELDRLGIPFPEFIRRDLVEDQRTNAGAVSREYELG
ncbi:MAG TPA: hypothetical protein VKV73_12755 [Chloroflexota bacterium]|nr:hypothetical protein [Chloroflexota bacterium]